MGQGDGSAAFRFPPRQQIPPCAIRRGLFLIWNPCVSVISLHLRDSYKVRRPRPVQTRPRPGRTDAVTPGRGVPEATDGFYCGRSGQPHGLETVRRPVGGKGMGTFLLWQDEIAWTNIKTTTEGYPPHHTNELMHSLVPPSLRVYYPFRFLLRRRRNIPREVVSRRLTNHGPATSKERRMSSVARPPKLSPAMLFSPRYVL